MKVAAGTSNRNKDGSNLFPLALTIYFLFIKTAFFFSLFLSLVRLLFFCSTIAGLLFSAHVKTHKNRFFCVLLKTRDVMMVS